MKKTITETSCMEETAKYAYELASKAQPSQVYALIGDLGVGKTVFTKGFARGLGIEEPVSSPTFTILQIYEEGRLPLYHFDVYRIEEPEEMEEVGFDDYIYGDGVCLIEWANRIEDILPEETIYVVIEKNLEKAVRFCRESNSEQELPNLYILLSQENVSMKRFSEAEAYCTRAQEFESFFPGIRIKAQMTRAVLYHAEGNYPAFWETYQELIKDPLYTIQTDGDTRSALDITYLRSRGQFIDALREADGILSEHARREQKHLLYAEMGDYSGAYKELSQLMEQKDSAYIKVQNEDLAILDAEMNNAQLREEAQQLRLQNDMALMGGFLVMFLLVFVFMLVQQWRLNDNLHQLRAANEAQLMERRAFQAALNAKEAENALRIKLLQKRQFNTLQL